MTRPSTFRRPNRNEAGFTLVEALAAVVLMSAIVYMLGAVTAQWLPNWRHGFERVQNAALIDVALQRMTADLAAAEFVPANGKTHAPFFVGTANALAFVRASFAPGEARHLELVRFAETVDGRGFALVRDRAAFHPLIAATPISDQLPFADAVALIRAPFRVTFDYAGADNVWRSEWRELPVLPHAIRVTVRDARTDRTLAISTATPVHIGAAADCAATKAVANCLDGVAPPADQATDNKPSAPNPAPAN